jgi:hypothetical protein
MYARRVYGSSIREGGETKSFSHSLIKTIFMDHIQNCCTHRYKKKLHTVHEVGVRDDGGWAQKGEKNAEVCVT